MVPYVNPANHAPGVQIGHAPGASSAKISFTYLRTYSNILMTCWLSGERSLPFGLLVSLSGYCIKRSPEPPHLLQHHPSPASQFSIPIAQLGERQTLVRKVAGGGGSILIRSAALSLRKTIYPHCLVLVKPRKPRQDFSQNHYV